MEESKKIKNSNNETVKSGCVIVEKGKVLLISSKDVEAWIFPQGHAENTETPEEVAVRETLEETGYVIEIIKKLPDLVYTKSHNGELVRVAMFEARPINEVGGQEEWTQCRWFSIEDARKIIFYDNLRPYLDFL